MNFAPVERFGVEGDGGGVAALGTADGDFPAQFDPGHGEDGAGVGAGQREDVLLIVLQQTKDSWGGGGQERGRLRRGQTARLVMENEEGSYLRKDIKSILLEPIALI